MAGRSRTDPVTSVHRSSARWNRCQDLAIHAVRDSRLEPHVIEFATAEAVFWLSAIDEALWAVSGYEEARDADEAGRLFDALRLARNGAAHSLLVPPTRPADIRAFIGGPDDDYAFYSSEAARWQFEPPDVKQLGKRHQAQVRAYLELLARKPVTDALAAATQWLRRCRSHGEQVPHA